MTERIVPDVEKLISLSDANGIGTLLLTIESQDGRSSPFKISITQLRYILSRGEAVIAKWEEENATTE